MSMDHNGGTWHSGGAARIDRIGAIKFSPQT